MSTHEPGVAVPEEPEPVVPSEQAGAELQPDDNIDESDVDSALGDDRSVLTQSLRSSLLESVKENGRGYHRYKSTAGHEYYIPEDELEQERLDLQHETYLYMLHGKLYKAPLDGDKIRDVLDVGTGTGIWAIDFADEYPSAQVVGTDLSPIQPQYVPPNCKFEIDDMNSEWTFHQKFDYIHARALCGASKDWPAFIRQAYNALKPGGWLEMPDIEMRFADADGTVKGTLTEEWGDRQAKACAKFGIDGLASRKNKQWFVEQGFENVTELKYKWPVGTWAKDPRSKYLGKMVLMNMLSGIDGFTLRLWNGVLEIPYEQCVADLSTIKKEISNPKIHSYVPINTVYGQKPLNA